MEVLADNPEWKHIKRIGKGSNASVHLFEHLPSETEYAIKFVERGHLIDDSFRKEIINHRALRHNNIIQFIDVVLTPGHLAIVMEYASGGDMFNFLKSDGPLTECVARGIMQQLISGIAYAHAQGVCHRDLKLENTLLQDGIDPRAVPTVKICDFGYAKSAKWQSAPKSKVGTPAYCAPEVFMTTDGKYDGKKADVWSLGITLHLMLTQRYPFAHPANPLNDRLMLKQVVKYWKGEINYEPPSHASPRCKEALQWMLAADADKRLTIDNMLTCPWFEISSIKTATSTPNTLPRMSIDELTAIFEKAKMNPLKKDPITTGHDDCSDDENSDYDA